MSDISLRKAKTIIRSALSKGKELGLKPLSVVTVDAGGHVIAFEREDEEESEIDLLKCEEDVVDLDIK
jgi:uncharacterized protein GlcG (DUF336 family)